MKQILSALFLLLVLNQFEVKAKCNCSVWVRVYNDGIYAQYWAGFAPLLSDVSIIPGDSLVFYVNSNMFCMTNSLVFLINGDTIFNGNAGDPAPAYHYTAYDTGHYYLNYFYYAFNNTFDFNVHYSSATGNDDSLHSTPPAVFPTVSPGVYKVQSPVVLRQLMVSDVTGKIILKKEKNFSEIDLSNFSLGFYFYSIKDEQSHEWRGKLLKN